MIELIKLQTADFPVFKSWIKNESELMQFAGPIFNFPLTDAQLDNYINDKQRISLKVVSLETNDMIGHCELNFENPMPRLSRVLIGDEKYRNKGLGKKIVNKMLTKLFIDSNFEQADLNVFDWNEGAIKCYQGVGFQFNPAVFYKHLQNGVTWTALNMTVSKDRWLALSKN